MSRERRAQTDYENRHWRAGRKVGRTIYAMQDRAGRDAADDDVLIGVMDTPAIAAEAVRAHNAGLDSPTRPDAS